VSRVEIAAEAMGDAIIIDRWWREHRTAAPSAFRDDLDWLTRLLSEAALLGRRIRVRGSRHVRRVLMPRTLHHAYYAIDDEADVVIVMRIWSAKRRRRPRL